MGSCLISYHILVSQVKHPFAAWIMLSFLFVKTELSDLHKNFGMGITLYL
jgi:hypothetical protein